MYNIFITLFLAIPIKILNSYSSNIFSPNINIAYDMLFKVHNNEKYTGFQFVYERHLRN